MLRKDNLNPSFSLVGSELALAAPEETRRSFHGHGHESCLSPYAAPAEAFLHPQSDAGLGSRGSAPRLSTVQPSRCLHCFCDYRPGSLDPAKPEQAQELQPSFCPSPALGVSPGSAGCPALTPGESRLISHVHPEAETGPGQRLGNGSTGAKGKQH